MLPRLGDLLFYTIAEGQERIPIHKFTTVSGYLSADSENSDSLESLEPVRRMVEQCRVADGCHWGMGNTEG